MTKRFALVLAVLALVANAGTVVKPTAYQITLSKPTAVSGTVLPAGDYKLVVADAKVTITSRESGKAVEARVKIENVSSKFDTTAIQYTAVKGAYVFSEIDLGGSKTKLVFAQ